MRLSASSIVEVAIAIALSVICLLGTNQMALYLLEKTNVQLQTHLEICVSDALQQIRYTEKSNQNEFSHPLKKEGCYLRYETIPLSDIDGLILHRVTATPSSDLNFPEVIGTILGQKPLK